MATALDIINRAMRLLGVAAAGESLSAAEASDGLTALNQMLDSWGAERLSVYHRSSDSHTLVAGTGTYTIGSGATINTTRPVKIESALIREDDIDDPVTIVDGSRFDWISDKSSEGRPDRLYYDADYPTGTINLHPVPDKAYTLLLYSHKPLTSFASTATSVSLPPGYERALAYNLAVEMAPEFGKEAPATVVMVAAHAKNTFRRNNAPRPVMDTDAGLVSRGIAYDYRYE